MKQKRLHLFYTPTHASWLNQIEIFFGILTRKVIRRGGRLTARSIRQIIIQRSKAAGVDGRVSGHSLRVGSAQSLANADASLGHTQVQTAVRYAHLARESAMAAPAWIADNIGHWRGYP